MRVAIGADLLDGPSCGMRIALEGLLQGMAKLGQSEVVNLIHARPFNDDAFEPFTETIISRGTFAGSGLYWSQIKVPRMVVKMKADLIHWPYQIMPPMRASVPRVISVWDLAPMNYYDPSWSKLAVFIKYRTVLYQALKSADRVIAQCLAIADELIERFDLPANKIEVIYPGLSELFQKEAASDAEPNPDGPILYVGTNHQRKNLDLLIKSYALLIKRGIQNRLALRVSQTVEQKTRMQSLISRSGIPNDRIVWIEPCDLEGLINVYRSSAVFAFPSLYEGFGLPLIEASACGLPVVALNRSAMPEVVGETGILVNEPTPENFARGLKTALTFSREASADIARQAKQQAAKFNWAKSAGETYDIYQSLSSTSQSNLVSGRKL